jgi:hypothetical protein
MRRSTPWLVVLASAAWLLVVPALAAEAGRGDPKPTPPAKVTKPSPVLVQAKSPPFANDGMYWPCSQCHANQKTNPERRELVDMHAGEGEPGAIFDHGKESRWCLDCHDADDRDKLRLANGRRIDFTQSYELCGQCHGDKLRDWRIGTHGKRIGNWEGGEKTYYLCVNCHNPHSPGFKGIEDVVVDGVRTVAPTQQYLKPMPRPRRPEEMRK